MSRSDPAQASWRTMAIQSPEWASGPRHRKRRYHEPVLRCLVRGQRGAHVSRQLLLVDISALRRPDHGGDFLTPFLVRQSDDGDLADLGMTKQQLHEFSRIDVLAATDDHVLEPALD